MRGRLLFLSVWLAGMGLHAGEKDVLRLLNGDRIRGELHGLEAGHLLFTPEGAGTPLRIPARFAGYVHRAAANPKPIQANVKILFQNGEVFYGRLTDLGPDAVRVVPPWGGEAFARLSMVQRIEFLPGDVAMPIPSLGTLEDWTVTEQTRVTETADGLRVEAPGFLTRNFRSFPKRFRLDVSLRTRNQAVLANIVLFSRRGNNFDHDSMSLDFNHGLVTGMFRQRNQQNILFRQAYPGPMPQELSLTLFGDLGESRFLLLVNGEELARWVTPGFSPGDKARPAISFVFPQFACEIQAIQLQSWGGFFPPPGEPMHLRVNELTAFFQNGDRLALSGVRADETNVRLIQTPESAPLLNLPFAQVEWIEFPADPEQGPVRGHRRDVFATLYPYGNRITLAMNSFGELGLVGEKDHWLQPLQIPKDFVRQIQFNIHTLHRLDREGLRLTPPLTFP